MPRKAPSASDSRPVNPRLLIDGDMLVYTLGFATETKGHFIDGSSFKTGDFDLCKRLVNKQIKYFCKLFNTEDYTLVVSGSGNYRTEFYPEYKANRSVLSKPICYAEIRQWMMNHPNAIVINGEEADDAIAALLTADFKRTDFVAITADKDFYTVPGWIYSITAKRLFKPTLNQCFSFLFFQALNGDRVDGYFGVKWMGAAKCQRLLKACHKKTIRQAYLLIKQEVLRRGKDREQKLQLWKDFRTCLSLAALRWHGETGDRSIGVKRVFKHRQETFEYFLPYYDVAHNKLYGQELKPVEANY